MGYLIYGKEEFIHLKFSIGGGGLVRNEAIFREKKINRIQISNQAMRFQAQPSLQKEIVGTSDIPFVNS